MCMKGVSTSVQLFFDQVVSFWVWPLDCGRATAWVMFAYMKENSHSMGWKKVLTAYLCCSVLVSWREEWEVGEPLVQEHRLHREQTQARIGRTCYMQSSTPWERKTPFSMAFAQQDGLQCVCVWLTHSDPDPWQGWSAWIIWMATPLESLSVKLIAPYTNALLAWKTETDSHQQNTRSHKRGHHRR